jgi:hypothetical protein
VKRVCENTFLLKRGYIRFLKARRGKNDERVFRVVSCEAVRKCNGPGKVGCSSDECDPRNFGQAIRA